jgi:ketosteroid isomerase-like protein
MSDRHEAARDVIRQLGIGRRWEAMLDPDIPPELMDITRETLHAYERADLDWLLDHHDRDIEIRQPAEFPDAQVYTGDEALIDALLDWPRQWEDFRMEPRRLFAADDEHLVLVALHRGRPHSADIEVEAEIVFLLRWHERRVTHWDIFMTVEEALGRAAERRAHGDDDHATERDGGEGAQETSPEEARPDHR